MHQKINKKEIKNVKKCWPICKKGEKCNFNEKMSIKTDRIQTL